MVRVEHQVGVHVAFDIVLRAEVALSVSLQVGVAAWCSMHVLHVEPFMRRRVEDRVHGSRWQTFILVAYQVLQTLADECGIIMLSLTSLAWLPREIGEELVSILDDLALHLLSLRRSIARLPIADVEVDLDLVEDGSALTLVVLVGFLCLRLETTDRIVAGCIQSFRVHRTLCDLFRSLLRVGIPGGVLTEDSLREGLLLLVVHLLRATWVGCGHGMVAAELTEQLLSCVAVARVDGHVGLVLDVREFGPARELSDGPV